MSTPLQASARSSLVSLVEEHLTCLVREAICVKRHCKRARVHLSGGDESNGFVNRRLHAEDINMALQWRGSEKLYATGTTRISTSEERKVDLEDYLKSEMDFRPPQEVGLTVHWLAVDGQQPDIPQNPSKKSRPDTVHQVDQEDGEDLKFGVQVNQLLPRLLSEELQLYFNRVTTALERGGATPTTRQQQDAALRSVARDAGLQELVPFLVSYVCQSLYQHIGNPEHCRTLIRMAHSLLVNPHLHLELHVSNHRWTARTAMNS